MSSGDSTEERRGKDNLITPPRWQPCWLVKTVLVAFVLAGVLNGWAVFASSETDSEQDSRITAVETNQNNILKNQEDQKILTRQLITLTTQTNLLVQTHIARSPGG